MKSTIVFKYQPSDRFIQFQFNEDGEFVDINFIQGLTSLHGFPLPTNEMLTAYVKENSDYKTDWLGLVNKCIEGDDKELVRVDKLCWDWFGYVQGRDFRSKAIAFGFSTPTSHELWKDYNEGCFTVDYDLYLRNLKDVVELMQETFDSAVYDSGHNCIRIERPNGYDQAIYIRWDDYKKRLVVDYHHGTDETDWNGNEDSLFHPMWDEFIYNNPITEFKTIGDYHRQLFERICYVVDLHTSLFCYRKVTKVTDVESFKGVMKKGLDGFMVDTDNYPEMSLRFNDHVLDLPWTCDIYDACEEIVAKVDEFNKEMGI